MKNLYAIFWMGIIFAGMPVIAGEESGDERTSWNPILEEQIEAAARRGVEPITFRYPRIGFGVENQPSGAQPASINVDSSSEGGSVTDEDADPDQDAVADEESERHVPSSGGAPRPGEVGRKKGFAPAYVQMWTDFETQEMSHEEAFKKIMQSLRIVMSNMKSYNTSIKTVRENLAQMQQVMPNSGLYNSLDASQKKKITDFVAELKSQLNNLEREGGGQARAATESGGMPKRSRLSAEEAAAGGGRNYYERTNFLPRYVTILRDPKYSDPKCSNLDIKRAVDAIIDSMQRDIAKVKNGRLTIDGIEKNLAEARRMMQSSALYDRLLKNQRLFSSIENSFFRTKMQINALKMNQEQARAVAQSGDLSVRSQASAGGAAAGGGGGGVGYQPERPLPTAQDEKRVYVYRIASHGAQGVAREDAFAILKESLNQWILRAAQRSIRKGDFREKISTTERLMSNAQYSTSRFSPEQIQEINLLIEQAKDQLTNWR